VSPDCCRRRWLIRLRPHSRKPRRTSRSRVLTAEPRKCRRTSTPASRTPTSTPGVKLQFVYSRYLVKHGDEYMVWDTGQATSAGVVAPKVARRSVGPAKGCPGAGEVHRYQPFSWGPHRPGQCASQGDVADRQGGLGCADGPQAAGKPQSAAGLQIGSAAGEPSNPCVGQGCVRRWQRGHAGDARTHPGAQPPRQVGAEGAR